MKNRKQAVRTAVAAALMILASVPAKGTAIPIPNGDFTQPGNTGFIGGGIFGGSGSGPVGSGPWSGAYFANLGVLLPPVLNIANSGGNPSGGHATISGIANGLNVLFQTVNNLSLIHI